MEEIINTIIDTTINSFDFGFCITVNVIAYIVISYINSIRKEVKLNGRIYKRNKYNLTTWNKRFITVIVSIICAICYFFIGSDVKIIFNSCILAPVAWSWIFKPIIKKLGIDYNDFNAKD